jgi:hypothetical protein
MLKAAGEGETYESSDGSVFIGVHRWPKLKVKWVRFSTSGQPQQTTVLHPKKWVRFALFNSPRDATMKWFRLRPQAGFRVSPS